LCIYFSPQYLATLVGAFTFLLCQLAKNPYNKVMLQSELFTRVSREFPKDEESVNARLLIRGGFIYKNSAGVYSFLPLGWLVMQKIAAIIREEMNAIHGQELFMPALVEKKYLDATGRWDVKVGFEARGKDEDKASFILGWTHEEVLTEIASKFVNSYRDLPFAAYQIQTKFRNEPRAKSGLLRGKEFIMKDLYSFHATQKDFEDYYEKAKEAYFKVFKRCGLDAVYTLAAGGDFTASNTHEFQVVSAVGEDSILLCQKCGYAENKEISKLKSGDKCPKCGGAVKEERSIEVGNIFPLGNKYSKSFNLRFLNKEGKTEDVIMGSYGIGLGRVMGTIVEIYHDERGLIWPESVAPFAVHLIGLASEDKKVGLLARKTYEELQKNGVSVLYDDRNDKSAGEKFAEADLMGMPFRAVISERNRGKIEVKKRGQEKSSIVASAAFIKLLANQ